MERGILEIMSWFNHFLMWLFPSPYTAKDLAHIPSAPNPAQANIFALYDYHHPKGKELVYYIKRQEDRIVSEELGKNMALCLQEYLAEQQQYSFFLNPIVIPVPLTSSQKKNRGFNQSEKIAKSLTRNIDGHYHNNVIYKNRETEKQALINNKSQRFINVRNCFSIHEKYKNELAHQDIIIVDDLVTTGATIMELEKTLRAAGARNVIAMTVAH